MLFHRYLWASVDPQLVRFAADLDWLKSQGVSVERFNLAQQPGAFAKDATVKAALAELGSWAGVGAPTPSIFTEAVAELVAIGAAIAPNCEPCFTFHYDKARKLGVSREDMLRVVTTARNVKDSLRPRRCSASQSGTWFERRPKSRFQ